MISSEVFYDSLIAHGLDFFSGVPDSLLKDLCAYITDHAEHNHITANEGNAIALTAGHYLATGRPGVVYMQNSGIGNAVNPLLSLNDPLVYGIPVLLLVGWRGEPGFHDEPQHRKQGRVTPQLFDALGIDYEIIDSESDIEAVMDHAMEVLSEDKPFACIIRKGTFEAYRLRNVKKDISSFPREEAIHMVTSHVPENGFIVATTGKISRELYEYRMQQEKTADRDLLTVGSMGHCSQIALGIALEKPDKQIFVYDGDGSILMHTGGMGLIGKLAPKNFKHIVFNNASHDSVGGQPTVADTLNIAEIAKTFQYRWTSRVSHKDELEDVLPEFLSVRGPALLEIQVAKGAREDLGRPTITMQELKSACMKRLET